jgi:hypothetical protein
VPGYSGTPLAAKLGVKVGASVAVVNAPDGFIGELPDGVLMRNRVRGHLDVVVAFFTLQADLRRRLGSLSNSVFPAGGLWVAWPKKTSGVETDMTDHAVRVLALPIGLVDNKVCAIDDTWTALRLVWRRENRSCLRR